MSNPRTTVRPAGPTRRDFIARTAEAAAVTTVAASVAHRAHAQEDNTVKLALVGCGGRGTGAATDALSVSNGPTKLVAMADVFPNRLELSRRSLTGRFNERQVDVPEGRRYIGFDAYRHAIDNLAPGDVVLLTTPPAFRWVHFTYAISKGVNVFMEKPVAVDGPTTLRMIDLAKRATAKNMKVGVGLMVRHCHGRQQLLERIRGGEIGDIISMRAYRMGNKAAAVGPRPDGITETMYQVQRFHSFLWASGGMYNDYYIHQIDECSWMKGAWPTSAHALGGRHYRDNDVDQNLDSYAVEYTYGDGTKLHFNGRNMTGCHTAFGSFVHGSKGTAIVSTSGHTPGRVRTFTGQDFSDGNQIWAYPQPEQNPYQLEWNDLIQAIRDDKPYNEVERGAIASLVSTMGRMAAHTGQIVTYEQALNHPIELAPNVDQLTEDGPAPLTADGEGRYPVPQPGVLKDREYEPIAPKPA